MGWLVLGLEFECSAVVIKAFTCPALTARSAGGDGDRELSLTFLPEGCLSLPPFSPAFALPIASVQIRGGEWLPRVGRGMCRAVMWVTICPPRQWCHLHLRTAAHPGGKRNLSSLMIQNHSLCLSFLPLVFSSPCLPSSSPTVLKSIKAAIAPPP